MYNIELIDIHTNCVEHWTVKNTGCDDFTLEFSTTKLVNVNYDILYSLGYKVFNLNSRYKCVYQHNKDSVEIHSLLRKQSLKQSKARYIYLLGKEKEAFGIGHPYVLCIVALVDTGTTVIPYLVARYYYYSCLHYNLKLKDKYDYKTIPNYQALLNKGVMKFYTWEAYPVDDIVNMDDLFTVRLWFKLRGLECTTTLSDKDLS